MVRDSGSIQFGIEKLKNLPVYDLFYCVALDTVGPLPKI
jgi:predicted amino acid dehydrogenase